MSLIVERGFDMKHDVINKKGFTLIELLAVISILAILMLVATGSVTSMVSKAQKNAFIIDSQNVVEIAKTAYMDSLLNGTLTGTDFCFSLDYLRTHGFLDKIDSSYKGSVSISIDGTTNVATYTLWLSSNKFQITGKTLAEITAENADPYTAVASTTCNGTGTLVS